MRVALTGGAGFVGSAVAGRLRADGHDVLVLDSLRADVHTDRGAAARERLEAVGAGLAVGDVRDPDAVARALHHADAVVHLAAKVGLGVDIGDMDDYVASNDHGTAVVLRVAAAAGVRRLVQASSMVVYGEGRYDCADHGRGAPARARHRGAGARDVRAAVPGLRCRAAPGAGHRGRARSTRGTRTRPPRCPGAPGRGLGARDRRHGGRAPASTTSTGRACPATPRTPASRRSSAPRSTAGEAPRVFEDGRQRSDFVHVGDVAAAFATCLAATESLPPGHRAYNVGSRRRQHGR